MVPQNYGVGEVSGLGRGFVRDLVAIRMEWEKRDFSGGEPVNHSADSFL